MTSVDSDQPVQPPFKLRKVQIVFSHLKSLTVKEYSSDKQKL